jgi:hypothetical protein
MSMTRDQRLSALLGAGYFPDELPPPFTTTSFARFRNAIGKAWSAIANDYPRTTPEIFSIPRAKGVRRDLSIVNPIAEYHVAKLVADNWVAIRKHLRSCDFGATPLEIMVGERRAVPIPDFRLIALRHAEISALHDYILVADISRFYGTLYTHAIPWALHTKTWSKQHLNTGLYNASLGAKLDKAVRKGNDNQTIGIPVGPDSSRIISEIVAVSVDAELRDKLNISSRCTLRNVDDWYIGFDTAGEAEDAIASIAAACRTYQLEIHPDKTSSSRTENVAESIWPTALRHATFAPASYGQGRDIEHFFALAFDFARNYPSQNVLDFAIKRTMAVKVHADNWHRYETYLLKSARSNPTTIPAVVQIFVSYNREGYVLGRNRINKLITDFIRRCTPTSRHAEIAWMLFLAKALRITLSASDVEPITELESSVCALLTLDLRSRLLVTGTIDTSLWELSLNRAGLTSSSWLLAYEAVIKGWLPAPTSNYIDAHSWFSALKNHGVSFYDIDKNVKHIRMRKPPTRSSALDQYLAGMRTNILPEHVLTMSFIDK